MLMQGRGAKDVSNDRLKICLRNRTEALELVQQLSGLEDSFMIENRSGAKCVNAKSVLGVLCTLLCWTDGLYLVNSTHSGVMPACVEPFRAAGV